MCSLACILACVCRVDIYTSVMRTVMKCHAESGGVHIKHSRQYQRDSKRPFKYTRARNTNTRMRLAYILEPIDQVIAPLKSIFDVICKPAIIRPFPVTHLV